MTTSSHFRVILDALNDYAKETGIDLAKNPFSTSLQGCNSPEDILQLIQDKAKAFKQFREGNRTLINWLKPVVSVVHAFAGTLGQVGTSGPASAANAIFAGLDVLIVTASKVSAGYDALVDLFECIGSFLNRLNIYIGIPPTPAMTDVTVKIMVEIISVLALATKNIKRGRFITFAKKLLGETEIEDVLRRLDRLTQEEARMTVAQTLEVVYGLMNTVKVVMDDGKASTENIRQALITMQGVSNEINKMKRDQLREKIRHWLSPPDPSTNHKISCEALHAGTAAWFLQGKALAKWKRNGGLMWIHGKLGSGKSVLLSAIIEDVEDLRTAGLACVAYYYFDFRDSAKQNRCGLLSSLLEQLCSQSSACYDILSRLYSTYAAGTRKATDARLAQCLKDVLNFPRQPTTYIFVDALDECPNFSGIPTPREKVLEFVADLTSLRLPNLRICVSSRPVMDIRTVLQPLASVQVSLHEESGQQRDLLNYISNTVHSDLRMRRWRDWEKRLVVDTLSRKADGMFRWVVCQLEILRRRIPASIRFALEEMPSSLDSTYEHMLLEIDEEKQEYAHRIFQCLAVSVRPLSVQELAEVLAVRFDVGVSPNFNVGWRSEDAEEVVQSACSSLVNVVNVGGYRIVQFSHFSVKEYLASSRLATLGNDLSRYHILPASAHTILARICLTFLLKLDHHINRNFIRDRPLARYAARHWVDHAQFEDVSSRIQDVMERFFDPYQPHFSAWVWVYDIDHHWGEQMSTEHPTRPDATPLYYAALCGFYRLAEHLILTRSSDVDARGGYYITPLHAAVGKGYLEIMRLLLQKGANVDVRDNVGSSPLLRAARGGKTDIARLLLEYGADVNFQTAILETPLHAASSEGEAGICSLLLDGGADLNREDTRGWTPLHFASRFGHHAVVGLLLDRGAGVNLQKEDLWTPLHLAAANEKHEVVKLLIQRGADVEIRAESGETALARAVGAGSLEIVRLLLNHGANLDSGSINNKGHTLLHTAALNGSTEIVRLLLDAGVDVDAPNKNSKTPLALASGNGRLEVVRLLIERGADPKLTDNQKWTSLHSASRHGHHDLVRLFLDLGIGPNVRKDDGWTPLHLASANGALEVVRALVQGGADVNARSEKQETPLDRAVHTGNLDITRYLIRNGAFVQCRDSKERSPLHLAARNGHVELMELLLNAGAEVDARCEGYKTPLALASTSGTLEAARVLIGRRADLNARDSQSWTPLHLASRHGHLNLVQLFLSSGASVDTRKEDSWTSLHLAAGNGHSEVARQLVQSGAVVDARANRRETPLDRAARGGKLDVARLLVDLGANVNAHDIKGCTPLHAASRHGHLEVVMMLLQRGAHINARNRHNQTPADQATENGKAEVASFLFLAAVTGGTNAGSAVPSPVLGDGSSEGGSRTPDRGANGALYTAAEEGNIEAVRSLLAKGVPDVNARDPEHHKTALDIASTTGNLEIARLLIGSGAEVDCRNKTGWTPLHRASRFGHRDVARLLLDKGADVNAKKQDHWTPLHLSSRNGHLETVRLLLERGADVHARNDEGRTPLQAALGKGHNAVVQLLSGHAASNA